LAGAAQLPASSARAQDYAAAGQHFDSAQEAFSAGKFELAAREYQAAFDITKESTLLASIGESWQRAGNTAKALTAYKAYLQAAPQAPDRAAIEERVKAIESAQADAQKPAQAQPNQAQPAQAQPAQAQPTQAQPTQAQPTQAQPTLPPALPGAAQAQPGQPPALPPPQTAQNGQIPQQTAQNGQIPQQSVPSSPATAQPTPSGPAPQQPAVPDQTPAAQPEANKPLITPPEPPPSKLRAAGWVSVASAVALITGGAVVGLGAQSRADEIRRRTTLVSGDQPLVYTDSEREAYTTLQSEGRSYNTAAISLFAVGGVAAATAITLFIVDFARKPKSEPAKQVLLLPSVSPGSVGLSVVGGL
jgi:tetratricopeptide (TPR) repeat protein